MHDLCRIRWYLTQEVAILSTNAMVSSHLDCCYSLFRGLSCFNQHKLQSFLNTLAHIVTNHRTYVHFTPILSRLRWLPVNYRCMFKTVTMVCKFLHSCYSTSCSHPDHQYPPFHSSIYKTVKHFSHSFAFDTPNIWNSLPNDVCSATPIASFRKKLKTSLFAKAYQS